MKNLLKAAQIAAESKDRLKNFRLGCVGLRRDGVFVFASNVVAPENPSPSSHAEARVLRKCGKGAIIWVARILRNGTWAMAKPCKNCQSLIKNLGVKKVYFTVGPDEWDVWEPGKETA